MKRSRVLLAMALTALSASIAPAQTPWGWEKLSGPPAGTPGLTDGIVGDRQNSYAWSMDVLGDHLYVGTNRNVFGTMLTMGGFPVNWTGPIPAPTDMRGRIYRMNMKSGAWSLHYLTPPLTTTPPVMGLDTGYRMMRRYRAAHAAPVLYAGSAGMGLCRLLAIQGAGDPVPIFQAPKPGKIVSIRAITEHRGRLFWAAEDARGPAIWYAADPLREFRENPRAGFAKLTPPETWFPPNGAEILDMISYEGWMYVFFLPYDVTDSGFWCGKFREVNGKWQWRLVVGDERLGARYAPGMGRPSNGGAVPILFHGQVYVGTLDGAAFRMMNGIFPPGGPPASLVDMMGGAVGMQIFRFDRSDCWERVMPSASVTDPDEVEEQNGFRNPLNKYIWRFGILDGRLYAGTFDIGTGLSVLTPLMGGGSFTAPTPLGFDLYFTYDGTHWIRSSRTGFDDPWNYGTRVFVTDPGTGDLYMGTANPFYGCQVWRKRSFWSLFRGPQR